MWLTTLLTLAYSLWLPHTQATHVEWQVSTTPVDDSTSHELTFWFHAAEPALLLSAVDQVSDPKSPSFRKYLKDEDIMPLVRPKNGTVEAVHQWLKSKISDSNFHVRPSKHGDFLFVVATVGDWRRAFDQKFSWYEHVRGQAQPILRLAGCSGHSKTSPNSNSHLTLNGLRAIFGLSDFYPVVGRKHVRDPTCNQFKGSQIDPAVIRGIYHNDLPDPSTRRPGYGKHAQAVAAFEDAQFSPNDVAQFQNDYKLTSINISVLGPNNGGFYGEASLDTQYIFATGSGVQTWFIAQEAFDMLAWSFLVANMSSPPAVLSVSWGGGESNYDLEHQHAASLEFAKLGLKGHTILAASGDDGTGGHGGLLSPCKHFDPTWPASSPFVTAVGGTYLDSSSGSQLGWKSSGGGFSANFARPHYQDDSVASYTSITKLPPANLFNASGRVTPDVSALSTNFRVLAEGAYGCLSGTSAATPVFAGLISLLNDELVAEGKPTLGFINPVLYATNGETGAIGFDVIEGNNKGQFCPAGFNAEKGFDAISGLGTPELTKLRTILVKDF